MRIIFKLLLSVFVIGVGALAAFSFLQKPTLVFRNHLHGWYAQEPKQLKQQCDEMLAWSEKYLAANLSARPFAAIVPHAGHKYSGIAAASVYATLRQHHLQNPYNRIVILTISHNGELPGVAAPNFDVYAIPGNQLKIDQAALKNFPETGCLKFDNQAFLQEHSLEVQLPFLAQFIGKTLILPLLLGHVSEEQQKDVLDLLDKVVGKNDFLLITSDFTHHGPNYGYTPFKEDVAGNVKASDGKALDFILSCDVNGFKNFVQRDKPTICGRGCIELLLEFLTRKYGTTKVSGRLTCYYSSLNAAVWNNFWPENPVEIARTLECLPTDNFVTYAGVLFYSKTQRPVPLGQSFSGYEQLLFKNMTAMAVQQAVELKVPFKTENLSIGLGALLPLGAFVTLLDGQGDLRGCIGRVKSEQSLCKIIGEVAFSACFEDSRFAPVAAQELGDLKVSLSILSQPRAIASVRQVELGKHGIILSKALQNRVYNALFLPEVPTDFGWDLEQTMEELSKKAGLPADGWKGNGVTFKIFETLKL